MRVGAEMRGMQPQAQEDWKPPETVKARKGPSLEPSGKQGPADASISSFWTPKLRQFGYLLLKPLSLWKCVTAAPKHWHRHTAFPPDWQLYNLDSSPPICFRIFLSKDSDTLKQYSNHPHLKQYWVHLLKMTLWPHPTSTLPFSKLANYPLTKLFSNNPWGLQREADPARLLTQTTLFPFLCIHTGLPCFRWVFHMILCSFASAATTKYSHNWVA